MNQSGPWKVNSGSSMYNPLNFKLISPKYCCVVPAREVQGVRHGRHRLKLRFSESRLDAEIGTSSSSRLALQVQVQVDSEFESEMPPKTRIIVQCPGCSKVFSTEQCLRRHRSHPSVRNRPCYLNFRQEPRISAWAPGAAGAAGQLDVSMGDFQDMYGGARYQSDSPDPGDDLRDPPSDFDEDLLGAGQPPGGGAAAPQAPDQVYRTYMY